MAAAGTVWGISIICGLRDKKEPVRCDAACQQCGICVLCVLLSPGGIKYSSDDYDSSSVRARWQSLARRVV